MTTPIVLDDVQYQHTELTAALPRYAEIRDCVEQKVKQRGELYLPNPSPDDKSSAADNRYAAYLMRAVFYAVTSRTLLGMIGQTYARPPVTSLPERLTFMRDDATGSGLSLNQLSIDTMYNVMAVGRAGIYIDYPAVSDSVTVAQLQNGDVRPTLTTYAAEAITNWRTKLRGSKHVLSLVVLREMIDVEKEFSVERVLQFRELRLIDDVYHVRVWREDKPGTSSASWLQYTDIVPLDGSGKPFNELPFTFVGSMNNDTSVDDAPLYDLAQLNLAHYRNSADYEEMSFIIGQPTPWFAGLTEEWVHDVLHDEVLLGSRAAVMLPAGAQAGLLQVSANSVTMEAMQHKEKQMVALGARLVESRAVRRTLGEVQQSNAAETSILASCANNVSAAYTFALRKAAEFVSADPNECAFKLNTDFALTPMDAADRMQLIADMQGGVLSFTEVRDQLRRVGIATQADTEAKAEIQATAAYTAALAQTATVPNSTLKIDNRQKQTT